MREWKFIRKNLTASGSECKQKFESLVTPVKPGKPLSKAGAAEENREKCDQIDIQGPEFLGKDGSSLSKSKKSSLAPFTCSFQGSAYSVPYYLPFFNRSPHKISTYYAIL